MKVIVWCGGGNYIGTCNSTSKTTIVNVNKLNSCNYVDKEVQGETPVTPMYWDGLEPLVANVQTMTTRRQLMYIMFKREKIMHM